MTRSTARPSILAAAAKPPTKAASSAPSRRSRPGSSLGWTRRSALATRCAKAPGAASPSPSGAAVAVRGGGEIGRADRIGIGIAAEQILDAGAVGAGRRAEDAVEARPAGGTPRTVASGFSSSVSSRAATACTAASMSAICAGKRSRNRPEMRQVTSTRARPIAAVGSTSMPVTRPLAWSQIGRQPISASPCAISSPPVRKVALPQRSMTTARGNSPWRLQMRAHDFVGGEPAEFHRGRRRQRARIGGEEIAAGRQHVAPPARRRAGRARRDAAAVERREQRRALGRGACLPQRIVAAGGRAAVNVQAVLDGEVLEVAQPGVDAAQRVVGRDRRRRCRLRAPIRCAARSRRSAARGARGGGGRARRPAHIRRSGARARARRRKARRQRAAAADGRSSRRRCGAWPAPPRPDC